METRHANVTESNSSIVDNLVARQSNNATMSDNRNEDHQNDPREMNHTSETLASSIEVTLSSSEENDSQQESRSIDQESSDALSKELLEISAPNTEFEHESRYKAQNGHDAAISEHMSRLTSLCALSTKRNEGEVRELTKDKRADSISLKLSEPLVPHGDILKKIRTNYRLKELTEEDYVCCLETIIERDYFPELVRLRMSNALLEAETRGDERSASILRDKIEKYDENQEVKVHLKTVNNEKVVLNLGKGGLTLDEFSGIFTSEDNRSFGRLMEKAILKSNIESKWMEDGEKKHNLALVDCQRNTNIGIKDRGVLANKVVSRNALFFSPPDVSSDNGPRATIRSTNTYMPSDHDARMEELDHKQKMKRTEKVKHTHYSKVNELITQYGLRECKQLLDEEQKAIYDFVSTPVTLPGADQSYSIPKPVTREDIAERLRKKYNAGTSRTTVPNTPIARTPLLVQNLIAKHRKGVDLQLRKAYGSSKHSRGSTHSSVL